tara:strand:+ start:61 stop:327 length:267 start_codon:yes stop_codon:yes gene_type:complete
MSKRITIATVKAAAKQFNITVEIIENCTIHLHAAPGKAFAEDCHTLCGNDWLRDCSEDRQQALQQAIDDIQQNGPHQINDPTWPGWTN